MKSQKQAAANRRNSLRSSGPRTEAGKRRSAINATKHGLTTPVESSDWAPHLDTVASLLVTEEGLGAAEAWELAKRIIDYERNVQYQRERFEIFIKGEDDLQLDVALLENRFFNLARIMDVTNSKSNNYGGLGKSLSKSIERLYRRWGTYEVKKNLRNEQRKRLTADRYLRRSANQLIKQCRRLSTPMIET